MQRDHVKPPVHVIEYLEKLYARDLARPQRLAAWTALLAVISAAAAQRGVSESDMAHRLATLAHATDAAETRRILGALESV
jgi:hypothetical protein